MNEHDIEQEIQKKNLTAPRLTPGDIDNAIKKEMYYKFPGTATTVCCLILQNGFAVVGESSATSLKNFDENLGQRIAKDNARNKVWMLEGYLLKQKLYEKAKT